jgi:hypothetical protein
MPTGNSYEDSFAPPLRIFAPPLKSHAPPLEKVSVIDQSQNLTFFGCLGSTLRKQVFCKIETVVANSSLCHVPF